MQWKFCSQMQQYLLLPAILLSLSSCTPVQEDPALPENSMQTDVPAEGSGNEDPENGNQNEGGHENQDEESNESQDEEPSIKERISKSLWVLSHGSNCSHDILSIPPLPLFPITAL